MSKKFLDIGITNFNADHLLCEYIVAVGHGLVPGLEEAVQLHGSESIRYYHCYTLFGEWD